METICCCLPWVKKKSVGAVIPLESSAPHETPGKDATVGGTPGPQYDLENQLGRPPVPAAASLTSGPPLSTDLGRGLKILYNPDNIMVDIIAVHGLNGHREKTFTAANNVCWLQSLLPKDFPNVRVMSYGYDARTHSSEPLTQEYIHGHSEQFVEEVTDIRMDTETMRVPIIFVAHSLGGLVLKNALTLSSSYNERHREDQMAFKISTYGVMFMGTPHGGGQGVTLGVLAVNIASIWFNTNTQLLKHLETNSEWLDQTQMRYLPIAGDFDTKFFYEGLETPTVARKSLLIVPKHSACIPGAQDTVNIRIDKNHVDMVKYADAADEDYQKIRRHMKVMLGKAVAKVDGNWIKRENEKRATGAPQVIYIIPLELPFPPNGNFTGRTREISKIHEILQRTTAGRPHRKAVVLYGMGGAGKTQIAMHYAYIHRESYTSIWYLNAESTASLVEGVTRIAQKLVQFHAREWGTDYASIARVVGMRADTIDNGTGKVITTDIALEAVKSWLGAEGNPNWLIVVDNYDDLENVNILRFLPNTSTGNLIITSRKRSAARLGEGIEVDAIEKEEGIELIRKSAHRNETQFAEEKKFAAALVEKLMWLPLSIDLAGSFIFESSISFKDYLTRFDDEFPSLMDSQPPKSVWQYEKNTFTTWEISFQRLGEQAQKLLLLCGFFNNDEISLAILLPKEKMVEFGIDSVDAAIREILSLSLAQRRVDTNALWIHPSVHRWSRERTETDRKMLAAVAIDLTAHAIMCAPLDRKPENWILERQLMPHLHACIDHACRANYVEGLPSETKLLGNMFTLAHALSENHDVVKANVVFDWLLPRMKSSQGEEGGDTLFTMHYMAHALSSQGRYREALELAQRVLAGRERVLGKDHHDTLESLHDVGYYFKQLGNNVQALKWYGMALEGKERVHGPNALSTLGTIANMAAMLDSRGEHEKAMEMYMRVLAGQEVALGNDHPTTLNTMHSIGSCYSNQSMYDEALEWNHKSLEGRKRVLGMEHQHTLTTVNNIGLIFKKQGKYTEALHWYRQALSGRETFLGTNHPDTLTTINNIALLMQSDGRYEESLPWHKRALDGREKTLGQDHRLTLQSYNNIASLYFYMKRYEDAMKWHEKTLAGRERVFGKNHSSTIKTVENMAVTFEMQGKYEDAVKMFEKVFDWKKNSPGIGPADLQKTRDQLSECKSGIMASQQIES